LNRNKAMTTLTLTAQIADRPVKAPSFKSAFLGFSLSTTLLVAAMMLTA